MKEDKLKSKIKSEISRLKINSDEDSKQKKQHNRNLSEQKKFGLDQLEIIGQTNKIAMRASPSFIFIKNQNKYL